jgi:phytoene/squalene synthetase
MSNIQDKIQEELENARAVCSTEGAASGECAAAWDAVEELQAEAAPGIAMLEATSRPCIQAASTLYCGIVDEVEKIGYDIFNQRAKTSTARRIRVAGAAFIKRQLISR